MTDLPAAQHLINSSPDNGDDSVVLTYDERIVRRKRLVTATGAGFLVDLPEVTNLDLVWGFELQDGRKVKIVAADEAVLEVRGAHLSRYAWHIGNRHTPCQIEEDRLVIRADHVLEAMLRQMGAAVCAKQEPFRPEVGAYGMGRPMGHDHGDAHHHHHDHDHGHAHDHSHDHDHPHAAPAES